MSELITNHTQRVRTLKEMMQQLHDGRAPENVKRGLRTLVRETGSSEITAAEQDIMAEGMPPSEVQRFCELHSEVVRESFPPEPIIRETDRGAASFGIQFPTGHLSLDQLRAIFSTLPLDVTFVDADDRVAFYSEGPDRIFARSKAVIGRKVQKCHPPRSVHIVERILKDFREGRQNVAEFWIQFFGRFVHIRYFAVHGEDNRYLGTLEVTQDLTRLRTLEGERRLLQFESEAAEEVHAQ
jgi:DUF438 domain-containing protein